MAVYRNVQVTFWKDVKVSEDMTPEDKLFYLYLLTNPYTTQIGIYPIAKKQIAFDLGYAVETAHTLIERFEKNHKLIKYNPETKEIAILNWGKYNLNRAGKPLEDCIKKELQAVKDKSLIQLVLNKIPNEKLRNLFSCFVVTNGVNEFANDEPEAVHEQEFEHEHGHGHEQSEQPVHQSDKNDQKQEKPSNNAMSYDTYHDTWARRTTTRGEEEKEEEKKEMKIKDKDKDKDHPAGGSNTYPEEFELFWSVYPRRVGKKRAFSLWKNRIKQEATQEDLMLAAKNYADYCCKKELDFEYIKHPSTFLSSKLDYEDWVIPSVERYKKQQKSYFDIRMEQDAAFFDELSEDLSGEVLIYETNRNC